MSNEKNICSYCGKKLGKSYTFNTMFINPGVFKCKRWWCNILTKMKILKKKGFEENLAE